MLYYKQELAFHEWAPKSVCVMKTIFCFHCRTHLDSPVAIDSVSDHQPSHHSKKRLWIVISLRWAFGIRRSLANAFVTAEISVFLSLVSRSLLYRTNVGCVPLKGFCIRPPSQVMSLWETLIERLSHIRTACTHTRLAMKWTRGYRNVAVLCRNPWKGGIDSGPGRGVIDLNVISYFLSSNWNKLWSLLLSIDSTVNRHVMPAGGIECMQ